MLSRLVELAAGRVAGPLGDEGLVQAAFDETVEQLSAKLGPQIFATGIPESFHANVLLARQFVSSWESRVLAGYPSAALARFRSSEALGRWHRAWKIDVYFTLRAQELIRAVEQALAAPLAQQTVVAAAAAASPQSAGFALAAVAACVAQMERLWGDDTFLVGLEASLLRLGLQTVSRLRTWLLAGLPDNGGEAGGDCSLLHWVAAHRDAAALARRVLRGTEKDGWRAGAERRLGSPLPGPVAAALDLAASELEQVLFLGYFLLKTKKLV